MIKKIIEQHIGVCIILSNSSRSKILLGKRLNCYKAGEYGIPGGRINIGESLIDAAKRELFEETKVTSDNLKSICTIREWQGTYDFIHFVFACKKYKGKITLTEPDKCESWLWFSSKELPNNILLGHKMAIELYFYPRKFKKSLIDFTEKKAVSKKIEVIAVKQK